MKRSRLWQTDLLLYALLVLTFFAYKVYELFHPATIFMHAYLEDLLALPLVLKTGLLSVQWINKRWRSFVLSQREVLVITCLFSVYFEWLMPRSTTAFTADGWDVVCYAAGSAAFLFWMNKPWVMNTETEALFKKQKTEMR